MSNAARIAALNDAFRANPSLGTFVLTAGILTNICIVQKLANHKNISTTQHYSNYNDQMLANAVENVKI